MKIKKKLLTVLLVLCVMASLTLPAFAAPTRFSDLTTERWYAAAVLEMADKGYISGYPDGTFGGDKDMTVAEYITLLANLYGLETGSQDWHWAGKQMAEAKARGWLDDTDVSLCGGNNGPMQRQLAAKVMLRALNIEVPAGVSTDLPFKDLSSINSRYLSYVAYAYRNNLITGDVDGNFYPARAINRAGGATLLYRSYMEMGEPPAEDPSTGDPSTGDPSTGDPSTGDPGTEQTPVVDPQPSEGDLSKYTRQEIIDYFVEVALHSEYDSAGNPGGSNPVHKWTTPIYYYVSGDYTSADLSKLAALSDRMNTISGFPGISRVNNVDSCNLHIQFLSGLDMDYYPGHYMPGLEGYATITWYTASSQIFKGGIGYRSTLKQEVRESVICEELIQALGMLNDSYEYADSIFYQNGSDVLWPSALDWKMVELLYSPEIRPGMTETECRSVLDRLLG